MPALRVRELNEHPVRPDRAYILYWMVAFRRTRWNFALQHAVRCAEELGKPLVIFEPLRCDYPHASDRLHRFVLDGMRDNRAALSKSHALYFPFVETARGEGKGLLAALAAHACLIVTDDWPSFFIPRMQARAAAVVDVRMQAIDSNGLLPLRATPRVFPTAASFRTYLERSLEPHLEGAPVKDPLARARLPSLKRFPREVAARWRAAPDALLDGGIAALRKLPIDHSVGASAFEGGTRAGEARLRAFIRSGLARYEADRSDPAIDGTSRLSPYLHFGQLSTHAVLDALKRAAPRKRRSAQRRDLFGLSASAEALLDELVVWRELGFNMASHREDAAEFASLPEWAKRTLRKHRTDPRPRLQTREALERGETGDRMFDAAQRQLRSEGWFHNAARMIWGKKILEYSATPEDALATMSALMNRYSLDGRDPNSISGFFWVLGRYDRPWGPERPIFGTVRFMTSDTSEKLRRYRRYIERYAPGSARERKSRRPARVTSRGSQ